MTILLSGDHRTELKIAAVSLVLLGFLYPNFRQDFSTAFAILAAGIIALILIDPNVTIPLYRGGGLFTSIAIGAAAWTAYLLVAQYVLPFIQQFFTGIIPEPISINSIISLQSQRVPVLGDSKITAASAQSFLVPLVENPFFFRGILEPVHDFTRRQTSRLGLGGEGAISISGIITSFFIATIFTAFHLTAKLQVGLLGYASTFVFAFVMALLVLYRRQGLDGIFMHVINNFVASFRQIGLI